MRFSKDLGLTYPSRSLTTSSIAAGVLCLALVACSGHDSTPPSQRRAASITVAVVGDPKVAAGGTIQVTATVLDQNGQALSKPALTFTSSNQSVATISATGLLTSVGPAGTTTVTATVGDVTSNALPITVVASSPHRIVALRGQTQSGKNPGALSDSLFVRVTDAYDNPNVGVVVTWTVTNGSTVVNATTTTDANGITSNLATLSTSPGVVTVIAALSSNLTAS